MNDIGRGHFGADSTGSAGSAISHGRRPAGRPLRSHPYVQPRSPDRRHFARSPARCRTTQGQDGSEDAGFAATRSRHGSRLHCLSNERSGAPRRAGYPSLTVGLLYSMVRSGFVRRSSTCGAESKVAAVKKHARATVVRILTQVDSE